MKLKNKKTGEIGYPYFQNWKEITCVIVDENAKPIAEYTSLAELNEEWEDYEDSKEFWYIYGDQVLKAKCDGVIENMNKHIGNYFETEEEAEQAVEKLKAWKRLKDNSWKPAHYNIATREASVIFSTGYTITEQDRKDLNLLFGGEE